MEQNESGPHGCSDIPNGDWLVIPSMETGVVQDDYRQGKGSEDDGYGSTGVMMVMIAVTFQMVTGW